MTRTLFFIRHGQTEWNAQRRIQGQWESDLTELGRAQAEQTASAVASLGVDAIYASPLRRARDAALALSKAAGLPAAFDDRLKEWSAGDWSGHLYTDVAERWPKEWAAWRNNTWIYRPPNAENFEDLMRRGGAFLTDIAGLRKSSVAIVSHGFITRAMLTFLLSLSPEEGLRIETSNDVFFRLRQEATGWRAERCKAGAAPVSGLISGEEASSLA